MFRLEPKEFFDKYIIGAVEVDCGDTLAIAYDEDALIQGLVQNILEDDPSIEPDDAYLEAREHFEFNIKGSCTFKGAPVFVYKSDMSFALDEEE